MLLKTLSVVCEGQKAYGKQVDLNAVFSYFKIKFEGRYNVQQVIYALDRYTDQKNDIPTPADILAILNPEKPRISEAAFVEAQKWQERNGWPIFSDAKDIIEAYREQEREKQTNHAAENKQLLAIAGSTFKRIEA